MKKHLLSLVLVLTLMLAFVPAVYAADSIHLTVGQGYTQQLIRFPADSGYSADQVPPGMYIDEDPGAGSIGLYLTGAPTAAGTWYFTVSSGDGQSAAYDIYVDPAPVDPPYITFHTHDVSCTVGDNCTLSVYVENPSNWGLDYVWYKNGAEIPNTNSSTYVMDTSAPAKDVYKCAVHAWKDGQEYTVSTGDIRTMVEAAEPVITSVSVRQLPNRVEYTVGEYLDVKGLALDVKYSDGHVNTVWEAAIECIPYYFTQPGVTNISARFGTGYTSFTVNVKEQKTVTGISVNTAPTKLKYKLGEMLDMAGLTIRVDYSDKSYVIADTSKALSCEPKTLNTVGEQKITVTYEGKTCEFKVNVVDPNKVSGIGFRSLPKKTAYVVGDTVDLTGLVLDVQSEGGNWPLDGRDSRVSVSPLKLDAEGTRKITVTFTDDGEEFKNEFSVYVAAKPVEPTPAPTAEPEVKEEEKETAPEEAPAAEETPAPAPAPAEEKGGVPVVAIGAAAALVGAGIAWLVLRKKK